MHHISLTARCIIFIEACSHPAPVGVVTDSGRSAQSGTYIPSVHRVQHKLSTREHILPSFLFNGIPNNIEPRYMITTNSTGTKTEIRDASTQRLVVVIKRRDLIPDLIRFPERNGGKSMTMAEWLKKSKLADGFPVSAIETENGRCLWKTDVVRRLVLYAEHDLEHPLAYLQPATTTSPFALVIKSGSINIADSIVASLLMLEQRLRMKEKLYSMAEAKGRYMGYGRVA